MSRVGATVLEFEGFSLSTAHRLLLRNHRPVALPPKAFDILCVLVANRDRVVTKSELLSAVWPDTFVEEGNLAQNISVLRRALGESAREHRCIVTVPGRGYRFAADVRAPVEPARDVSPAEPWFRKGRHLLDKRLTSTLREAITCFLQATDEDPAFAPAWAGLADAYALLSLYGASMPREAFPKSKAAAQTALRYDPNLAEAHNALGVVALFFDWNWLEAETALSRAIALNPALGDAHQRYGIYLTTRGRFDEASVVLERAQSLDPLSRITATIAAYPAYYSGRFDVAAKQLRHVLEVDPRFSMAHFRLGLTLAHLGRFAQALEELAIARALSNDRDVVAAEGLVQAMQGNRAGADAALAELNERSRETFVSPYTLATIHAALGDHDTAFTLLERAMADRSYWIIYLDVDPALGPLRSDARFDALRSAVDLIDGPGLSRPPGPGSRSEASPRPTPRTGRDRRTPP
ncbi:MAG: winged helix-turn-helix domain-containing protein [Vicinamibacterales bacterium]